MKIRLLLAGVALTAIAASAVAAESAGAPGRGPAADAGGDATVPRAKRLESRQQYWTEDRYRRVKPMPLPKADSAVPRTMMDDPGGESPDSAPDRPGVSGAGQPPALEKPALEPLEKRLRVLDGSSSNSTRPSDGSSGAASLSAERFAGNAAVAYDVGFRRAYFSSQSLVPVEADRAYPYSAIGRLFFRIPGKGNFACSGSVISPRLVLTAGHCVHSGSGDENGWYTDFEFVPAYRDGVAPFSTWTGTAAFTTTPWYNGKDRVPNAADYAVIEIQDQTIDGVSRKIGEVVGYLGYQTDRLIPNHAHLLGYPVAFDDGERMHQVTAKSFRKSSENTVLYGSDMTEGSSGGPWIMNFGPTAGGQAGLAEPARNQVIGVTSYGFESIPVEGSSTLDDNFVATLNSACAHREGNCP